MKKGMVTSAAAAGRVSAIEKVIASSMALREPASSPPWTARDSLGSRATPMATPTRLCGS